MHVIALQGPGSAGKTTSIAQTCELLKALFPGSATTIMKQAKREVSLVLVVQLSPRRMVRIGIESRGDTEDVVEGALDALRIAQCDVILCATRTSGGSVEALNSFVLANGCTLSVLRKEKAASPLRIEQNARTATRLLGEIAAAF